MKKYQIIGSYVVSFAVLLTAIIFSVKYLVNIVETTRLNYHSETVYLTQGDSLQNYYSATIPDKAVTGMLVLNSVTLSPEGYRLAAEKGLIVISATPVASRRRAHHKDSLLTFRRIIAAAAQRYQVREDLIMIGDFSEGDTAYVTCKKARNQFTAEPFHPRTNRVPQQAGKSLVDETGLISWTASVFVTGEN